MKSKLVIITALVSIAVGLPVKAVDTRIDTRSQVVRALASAECLVKYGHFTREQVYEMIQLYINDNPQLSAAYSWALVTPTAKALVKELGPYVGFDCRGLIFSEEEADRLMLPYVE